MRFGTGYGLTVGRMLLSNIDMPRESLSGFPIWWLT